MSIFFNTFSSGAPELRSIFSFNRISTQISESLRRLETGQRIIAGKDDPSGLLSRETMRLDIRGIQSAQKNTKAANEFLSTAESGLANISRLLIGDINNKDDNGLIGLIYDTTLPTDMKMQQINDILSLIDSTVRVTNYNGKRMLDGSMVEGALFQLGKDVQDSQQYRMAMPSMTTSHLGGASGTLFDLQTIDLETDEGKALAYSIINEAINMVATQRGTIGAVQKYVLDNNAKNLDVQLERVSESEALISNVDMALESSRLNRAEILAQSAMNAILYSRNFGQFILNALL
jgi:flagellin